MNTKLPATETLRRNRCRSGSAVLIFLVLLSIMLALVAGNGRTLNSLKREIRLIEQSQVRRLERSLTNSPPIVDLKVTPPASSR